MKSIILSHCVNLQTVQSRKICALFHYLHLSHLGTVCVSKQKCRSDFRTTCCAEEEADCDIQVIVH